MPRQAALLVFWAFTVYAFIARSLLQKLRTRDSGIRGVARDRGVAAQLAGVAMIPAWLVIGVAPALTDATAPLMLQLAGVASAIAGTVLAVSSQLAMGTAWRIGVNPGERTGFIHDGPFRWVRNPFFTGMLVLGAGTVGAHPTWLGVLALAALAVALSLQVRLVEEPHLQRTLGAEYVTYAQHTGRFLPGIGRLPP